MLGVLRSNQETAGVLRRRRCEMTTTEDIYEQAALWHQGQHRDDFDWDGFTRWLAANPEHRACYNEIALLDEEIDRLRPALLPRAVKNKGARKWLRWRIVAGAVAASAVAIVSLPLLRFDAPTASPVYRTAASEMRSVTLPSGAKATLAPGSTLVANVDNARHVRLTGTAFFDVRHDPASPFTVEAADFLVKDVGTRFDVSLENGILRVAVQAGTVSVSSVRFAQPVVLDAGKALFADPGRGVVEITAQATEAVGSWRRGRLVYNRAPLGLVVADVSRYAGRRVEIGRDLANRRFSGVITIEPGASAIDTLKQLTGLDARVEGSTVRLVRGAGD
ncbi:FecR domain-containing protein [Sphingomonas paucimobilis]|nr:FecR domain-containing protein [Sphingomonas paucimobilis]